MELLTADSKNISRAAEIIRQGGLVAFPTETVYGLGADGLNPIAAAKIFEVKKRPSFNPLILHISDEKQLFDICEINTDIVHKLIETFWPGPLTFVLPKKPAVPDIITAGNHTVAVRMPDHPVALELIKKAGRPVAAPSANLFSKLSPTTAAHVAKQLGKQVDIILDGGNCRVGVESTIISFEDDDVYLLRPGGLNTEEIEKITGPLKHKRSSLKPEAPGMLPFHYAPSIPIYFLDEVTPEVFKNKKTGGLFFNEMKKISGLTDSKILSPSGNLMEAAAKLFRYLHEFEDDGIEIILAEKIDEAGLGKAIMDRLKKAVKKYS